MDFAPPAQLAEPQYSMRDIMVPTKGIAARPGKH